jgi:enoyl-CoA hydratase/carnithine racemase
MGTLVTYATEKGVALITLTDPPVNAYTHEMMKELDSAILEARFDQDVHVIIVTGHGDKHFCAGANINMLREADEAFKYYFCLHANETLLRLEHTPKLVIAALNGNTMGGGLEIALACDLRVAREGAFQIGLPEVALGVMPGTGGTQRLTRLLGKGLAMEMMTEGDAVTFEEGLRFGLINKLWSTETHDAFVRKVIDYAHTFTPPNKASKAVGYIKLGVQAALEMPIEQGLAFERELQASLFATHDAKEGLVAFSAKRKAVFKAR